MSNTDDIVDFIIQKCITVTDMVAESRENSVYSQPIRKCRHYIHTHLHERLDVATLSKNVDYPKITYHIYSKEHRNQPVKIY